jgi:tetratricopeptide (TPR) repeat protein
MAADRWARSNVNFLLGFNARLNSQAPEAERYFRQSYEDSPGNFAAARELASVCMLRGNLDEAEIFARRAFEVAQDNPFILDILLSVLIKLRGQRRRQVEPEISVLFDRLQTVGDEGGRSFYATRRAEYEWRARRFPEACRLIDEAAKRTPGLFNVHALRAEIYLDRGNKIIAWDEIKRMEDLVYRNLESERHTNLRTLLEIEASYYASNGEFDKAKEKYQMSGIFSEEEQQKANRNFDHQRAMTT